MNKEELFQELSIKINTGEISRKEIADRLNLVENVPVANETVARGYSTHFSINQMLYILGAITAVIGVLIFVYRIWDDIGSSGHILVTLGFGILMAVLGSILLKQKPESSIGSVFHCIGGILIPGGALVTLHEFNTGQDPIWPLTITFGTISIFYLLLNFIHRSAILTFFTIVNGTAFVYLLVAAMTDSYSSFYLHGDLYAYLTMVIGASYLLLARSFKNSWNNQLTGVLCFFGSIDFLGAAFSRVFDSVSWQMVYFLIVIAGLFLSAYMRSRAVLVVSTLFLIAHVSYITSKYFADSLGWPISLVILGFLFIGLGYISININKKYIAN